MDNCTHCNQVSPRGAMFCIYCGHSFAATGPTQRLSAYPQNVSDSPTYTQAASGSPTYQQLGYTSAGSAYWNGSAVFFIDPSWGGTARPSSYQGTQSPSRVFVPCTTPEVKVVK